MSRRLPTLVSVAAIVPLGFLMKFYDGPLGTWVSNSLAGAAYVVFWCLLLFLAWPRRSAIKPIVGGVVAVTSLLEALQLWHPPWLEAIRSTFAGRALIGTTFVWSDYVYYAIGGAAAWLWLRGLAAAEAAGEPT